MTLQNLRLFRAACQNKSIKKAADALNLSYQAVAYGINELEMEFQVTLFEKKGRNVALTREGERFYQLTCDLLERAHAVERSMHEIAEQNDRIHIGIPPVLSEMLFRRFEMELTKQFPEIVLQRYELGAVTIKERLLTGQLDCAICLYADDDPTFNKVLIGETKYVCCVGQDHPLSEALFVSASQIKDEEIVVLDSSSVSSQYVRQYFEREGLMPNIVLETSQLNTIKHMVSSGKAISFIYKDFAELYPNQMVCVPIDDPKNKQLIYFIWPKNRSLTTKMAKLISYLSIR